MRMSHNRIILQFGWCVFLSPDEESCSVEYSKVGCFKDDLRVPRPLVQHLFTDGTVNGHEIQWGKWDEYMPDLVCRCAESADNESFNFFGINNFG